MNSINGIAVQVVFLLWHSAQNGSPEAIKETRSKLAEPASK